jgi:hypothetical protein
MSTLFENFCTNPFSSPVQALKRHWIRPFSSGRTIVFDTRFTPEFNLGSPSVCKQYTKAFRRCQR